MIGVKSKKCSVAIWELSSALRGRSPFLISFRLQTVEKYGSGIYRLRIALYGMLEFAYYLITPLFTTNASSTARAAQSRFSASGKTRDLAGL